MSTSVICFLALFSVMLTIFLNSAAWAQPPDSAGLRAPIKSNSGFNGPMTLGQIEQIAIQANPTLAQAETGIQAARAKALQAGLMPNPVVGGEVENFAFKALDKKPGYFGFAVQTIPLGGKLAKMRRVYQAEVSQAEIEASSQRQRAVNIIRSSFYQVLGAQQQLDLQTELTGIYKDATYTTSELFNVGQADKPDFLESQIEKEQSEHELVATRNSYLQKWRALAILLGSPESAPVRLQGNLEDRIDTTRDEAQIYQKLLEQSPQMKAAYAQIQRAQAVVIRAKAEPIPDLYVRSSLGYSTEFLDTGEDAPPPRTGLVMNGQLGMTLPIFNRNPGGIASAQAELNNARHEVERLKMVLRIQLASAMRQYNTALDAVQRYRNVILPRADEAYQLQKTKFSQMSASYPQVLIARRTTLQMREKYVDALVRLQQGGTQLEGFLLSGGLTAPRMQFGEGGMAGLEGMQASEEADINSLDEAHNVDHY